MIERPDGLTVREATPADQPGILALNRLAFSPREEAAVAHLLADRGYGPGRWTVAVDAEGTVLSCATLFPHTLRYGGTLVPAAQVEFVATAAEVRRLGLVRDQFALHHRWAAEDGALLTFVTGIPYLYRRLGYGYGIDYAAPHLLHRAPTPPADVVVVPATPADVPAIAALRDRQQGRHDLALQHGPDAWAWLVDGAATWDEQVLVARRHGEVVGWARLQPRPEEDHAEASGGAVDPDGARALVAACAERAGPLPLFLLAHHHDPWDVVVAACAHHDPARFNGVYVRIPDLAALLEHLRPELSARLAASPFAAARGQLRLSCYGSGVILNYEDGEVTAVVDDPDPLLDPLDDDLPGVPPDQVPALVLGRWGALELERRIDDVGYLADRQLLATLFPRLTTDITSPC